MNASPKASAPTAFLRAKSERTIGSFDLGGVGIAHLEVRRLLDGCSKTNPPSQSNASHFYVNITRGKYLVLVKGVVGRINSGVPENGGASSRDRPLYVSYPGYANLRDRLFQKPSYGCWLLDTTPYWP